jgi:Uma2 family endonuclease
MTAVPEEPVAFTLTAEEYARLPPNSPPEDIMLAVEVVSPHSGTRDRLHKPGEYAEAGIPHYWRVEIRPGLVVHTYRLGETGPYLETGLFVPGDTVTAPGLPWAEVDVGGRARLSGTARE